MRALYTARCTELHEFTNITDRFVVKQRCQHMDRKRLETKFQRSKCRLEVSLFFVRLSLYHEKKLRSFGAFNSESDENLLPLDMQIKDECGSLFCLKPSLLENISRAQ